MKDGYACCNKIGELCESMDVYGNPYDLLTHRIGKELCIVDNNKAVFILPTKLISLKWAIACAEHVLYLFEKKFPTDKRPYIAIDTTKKYLKMPTEENAKLASAAFLAAANAASNAADAVANAAYYAATASKYAVSVVIFYTTIYYAANTAYYAAAAAAKYSATNSATNSAKEIKWQRDILNKIVRDAMYGDLFVDILASRVIAGRKKNILKDIERLPPELL